MANWWVSKSSFDTNSGATEEQAKRTFSAVIAAAANGDTIRFAYPLDWKAGAREALSRDPEQVSRNG